MKPLLIIIIPLLVFIALALCLNYYIDSSASKLLVNIDDLKSQIDKGDWTRAKATIKDLDKSWGTTRRRWNMFIDHNEVDRIDDSMTRVGKWIELKEKKDCLVELAALSQALAHIPENEKLLIANIF